MRLTPWLSLFSKPVSGAKRTRLASKHSRQSTGAQFEQLEDRVLLTTLYVDDNLHLTGDIGAPGLSNGDTVTFAFGETAQQTGLIFGTNAFSTIQDAINAAAASGDEIHLATGTYLSTTTLNINKSVVIEGVGTSVDDVKIQKNAIRTGQEDRVLEIFVPNVTLTHLTVSGWQVAPTVGELGTGYNVWTTQASTTLDDVRLDGDDLRGAVYFGSASNFTLTDSRITGTYFRGAVRGGGQHMDISYNSFEESHYWYSPIYMDTGAATSGTIDHNYFANRLGVNNQFYGNFKSDADGFYAITNFQPTATTADGLYIEFNTFDFKDADAVSGGKKPSSGGVYISPTGTPGGPIEIKNNIFQGYKFNGVVPPPLEGTQYAPVFRPGQGQFGGALEFDGVDDFATFQSQTFNVGQQGTLNFWVKMDNTSRRNEFFEGPDNAGFEMQYRSNSGGQIYGRVTTDGDFVIRSGSDGSIAGTWTNIQYTWDYSASNVTGKMRIYVNGVESSYLSGFTPNDLSWAQIVDTTQGIMNVGRDLGDSSRGFDGMMDDVAWFNRVLSPAELTAIRTNGVAAAPPANMVAYWDMNDAPGTIIAPGNGGTSISLYLGANPSPPLPASSAIIAPVNTLVDYNLFFNNSQNFNSSPTDGGHNLYGDPRFVGSGATPEMYYTLKFGSPALNASSEFPTINDEERHIGAFQGTPVPPASIVYVDDSWAGTAYGDDPDGAGPALFFGVDSFATVQAAVDLVDAGGTIIVYAGTYAENVSINKNVTIDGNSPSDTFIDGGNGVGVGITIVNPAATVILKDLKIAGSPTALLNSALAGLTLDTVVLINYGSTTTVYGTGVDDTFDVRNNLGVIEVRINGGLRAAVPANVPLTFEGLAGSDTLSVDYAGGNPVPTGGLVFNGGTGLSDKMELKVQGNVQYTPDAAITGNGVINVAGSLITFTGLEPVDFDFIGPGIFTLTLPGAADIVNITNGTTVVGGLDALVLSGSSGGVAFETAHVRDATGIVIDTTTVAGTDLITIASASNAHNNGALTVTAGAEVGDVITVNGTTTFTGTTTLNASTINLNANVINAITGTTATVVNVNNSTAQIQDGVDVALAGATVNVASGFTYAEAVTVNKNLSLVATGVATASIAAVTGPALTVSAGTVNLTRFNVTTSAASSTLLVTGGSLKLRENSIVKSGSAPAASIIATGAGVLNLGANPVVGTSDPGQNSITGSGALLSSVTAVDASGNWWGTSVQATIASALTPNVDYSPYLNSGADVAAGTPGFQSSFNDITVHTDGPQTGPDARITEGYNTLAATGTIHVLTGTYAESVNLGAGIDKSVTFAAGASPGQVHITGDLTFTSNDTLPVELNGTSTSLFDSFQVDGTVNLGNANLVVTVGYGAVPYDRFTIINKTSVGAVTGTFNGLGEGAIIQVPGGPRLRISYIEFHNPGSTPPTPITYGDGNDVSLTVMLPPILVTFQNGNLTLDGTGWNDDITLVFTGTNTVTVIGNDVTNFTGPGTGNAQLAGPYIVTGNIKVNLGNGQDKVLIRGVGGAAVFDSGNLTIDMGNDDDTVTTIDNALVPIATTGVTLTGNLTILGGAGNDTVTLGSIAAADFLTALNVNIDTGTGNGTQSIALNRVTANGNMTLANGGTGAQSVSLGATAANSVTGGLTINQLASALSYTVGVRDTSVGGNLLITNGSGPGAAAVTVDTTAARTVGGLTQITNGNNLTNAVSLNGTAGALRLAGNITVKNGNATTSNTIAVTDLVNSGSTSSSFTNGISPANLITFGGGLGTPFNTFVGVVAATNGNSTGTNVINATRLSSTKGINLTNGTATTSNDVSVGGAGTPNAVSVTGNLVIANGASADIDVDINNLTTNGANAVGDINMTNAASGIGGTTVTFGAIAANTISGNVKITNQTSTGLRSVVIDQTAVNGRQGVNLYEIGAGNTSLTVGVTAAATIANTLTVQDGTGTATVNLHQLAAGGFNYSDLGGGTDTITLAINLGGTVQINGVTRIDTGAGSDTVNIATNGTAFFNDSVFISLGAGNDLLFIGANADSPAFNGSSKFQFDGGAGTDVFNGSPLSLADYFGAPLGKKLKSKITGFESLLTN